MPRPRKDGKPTAGAIRMGKERISAAGTKWRVRSYAPTGGAPHGRVVSAGDGQTCAVTTARAAKCWGLNNWGQLGDGTTVQSTIPVDVVGLGSEAVAVSAGLFQTCAVTTSGLLRCWGNNQYGSLGGGTLSDQPNAIPVDVVGLGSPVSAVSAGGGQTCAVLITRAVRCWGAGDGTIRVESA
jgi:alpha-tubulin suppressor-like RCC1 family protein